MLDVIVPVTARGRKCWQAIFLLKSAATPVSRILLKGSPGRLVIYSEQESVGTRDRFADLFAPGRRDASFHLLFKEPDHDSANHANPHDDG